MTHPLSILQSLLLTLIGLASAVCLFFLKNKSSTSFFYGASLGTLLVCFLFALMILRLPRDQNGSSVNSIWRKWRNVFLYTSTFLTPIFSGASYLYLLSSSDNTLKTVLYWLLFSMASFGVSTLCFLAAYIMQFHKNQWRPALTTIAVTVLLATYLLYVAMIAPSVHW